MKDLMEQQESNEIVIAAPRPEAFVSPGDAQCPACENSTPRWMRMVRVALGLPGLTAITVAWCGGGKPPSEPRGPMEAAVTGQQERIHTCAGMEAAHLHYRCGRCGFGWIVATRQR